MNNCFWYFTHAFMTILPWILLSFVRIKFIMVDLLPTLFAQIDNKIENVVCPDEYRQPQWILFSDTIHNHQLWIPCEVLSGYNSKWTTYRHFCCLKLTKYLKNLSVRMNISNTNAYLFPIIYTCINYNPPMNPYNLQHNFYPVGDTIALAIYLFILLLHIILFNSSL